MMTASAKKTLVDVSMINEDGNKVTHTFRLPTAHDWQKNLLSLHKKITKKFDIHHEYALRLKRNIVDRNDHKAIADIIKHSDLSDHKVPHFDIVDINLLNAPSSSSTTVHKKQPHLHVPRRKIMVHFIDEQIYTFTLPLDISESDDNFYTQLLTEIRQKLKLKQNKPLALHEKCNGKRIEIDDWDDLYETLQDKPLNEPVHLYLTLPRITSSEQNDLETESQEYLNDNDDAVAVAPIYENKIYLASKEENHSIAQDRIVKIVLLGDSAVGKTSIEQRFVWNRFSEWLDPTVGAMFSRRTLDYGDFRVTFEIWDTAGQERFRSLTPLYYRDATAALVVYDITSYRSYDNALKWVHELHAYDENIVVGLCGNKIDLYEHRKVEYNKAKHWVVKQNIALFAETSAKSNVNITQMFRKIGEVIVKTTQPKAPNGFCVSRDYDGEEFEANYDNGWCYGYCKII